MDSTNVQVIKFHYFIPCHYIGQSRHVLGYDQLQKKRHRRLGGPRPIALPTNVIHKPVKIGAVSRSRLAELTLRLAPPFILTRHTPTHAYPCILRARTTEMATQCNELNTSTDPVLKPESSEANGPPDPEGESASIAANEVRIILEHMSYRLELSPPNERALS